MTGQPSGEQLEIGFEDQRVVVTEVGGGLRAYSAAGRELLDGYGADVMSPSGRGQVLIPWPNRIAEGRYVVRGQQLQLPVNEHDTRSAIHGLVRWVPWHVAEREANRVVVRYDLHPQPGYPFALALRIDYTLTAQGLRVATTATNVGTDPCPYGAGAHPYLDPGPITIDTATLLVPARSVLDVDPEGIPVGSSSVDGTEFDFRRMRPVGETRLDHCFTDLERDDDGLTRVILSSLEHGTSTTLWADEAYPYLMLYSGDDRPDVLRRSLAVEPMTCPPQAFRSGEGVVTLAPGESITTVWGLSPS